MQVNLLNSKNIYNLTQNYQANTQKQKFNSVKNDVFLKQPSFNGLNPEEIFRRFSIFDIAEYKKLLPLEIKIIRENMDYKLMIDRNAAIVLSKAVRANFDEVYPNGYVFVSIGRSPAVIGKSLEYQGINVKYCPISELGKKPSGRPGFFDNISILPSKTVHKYKEYLNKIGLSMEEIKNSANTYVFTDFCGTGNSLKLFQTLLERPEIGIKSNNVQYKSLNKDILLNANGASIEFEARKYNLKDLVFKYLQQHGFKLELYPHIQRLSVENLGEITNLMEQPYYYEQSKKMNFALIDYFVQKGLLKE